VAVAETAESVIDEVTASGLRVAAAAGFSTGSQWKFARPSAGRDQVVICNADEGRPAARSWTARSSKAPHAVLEGHDHRKLRDRPPAHEATSMCAPSIPSAVRPPSSWPSDAEERATWGRCDGHRLGVQPAASRRAPAAFVCGEETRLSPVSRVKRGMRAQRARRTRP